MVDEAKQALGDVDVVVLLIEPPEPPPPPKTRPGRKPRPTPQPDHMRIDPAMQAVLDEVLAAKRPTILALNKVDQLRDKRKLLPLLEAFSQKGFAAMVPISAKSGVGVDDLVAEVVRLLPEGDALFDDDTLTDRAERWFVTEFVREQVFLLTKREVPYSVAVSVDEFEEREKNGKRDLKVAATISVDKEAHKRILVGEGGRMIREIGSRARHELGQRFDATVHLSLFIRVDEGWASNAHKLRELGYET
jgi:GTP-binding protein Era